MAEPTETRFGELARGVLAVLAEAPDGLAREEVLDRLAVAVPPTPPEKEDPSTSVGAWPYEAAVRRSTVPLARAGYMTKAGGHWSITPNGKLALARFPDPLEFYRAAVRGRGRDLTDTSSPPPDVGDIFAGCFLSIAGSLVGAVVGTLLLLARMLPGPDLRLIAGFGAAFIVGFVVGLVTAFVMAPVALRFGSRAENVWVGSTALAAAIAAALTPSLLIAVETGSPVT